MTGVQQLQKRGDGSTTKQILSAPNGAAFIWNNEYPQYAIDLTKALKRSDIKVYPASVLRDGHAQRLISSDEAIVVDHGLKLSAEEARNLQTMKRPGRAVVFDVIEPNLIPEKFTADVMAWNTQGTGLIIRGDQFEVRARLKYAPAQDPVGPSAGRDKAMALMNRLADLINEKSHHDEGGAKPSQEISREIDRDEALNIVRDILANPATPKALKKKFSDTLAPLL